MKHLLLTTIAAVVLVGCGESQSPEPTTAKAPAISIHDAAGDGNIEAVKKHLAAGVDVNAKDGDLTGFTPLHKAAYYGHKEVAELLIANGADVNAKGEYVSTPLGRVSYELTPLHWAAYYGHKEVAELLIANGADVNAQSDIGHTPLDMAIGMDRTEAAALLRKHGGKTGED
jgi:ankyrin repeat protein